MDRNIQSNAFKHQWTRVFQPGILKELWLRPHLGPKSPTVINRQKLETVSQVVIDHPMERENPVIDLTLVLIEQENIQESVTIKHGKSILKEVHLRYQGGDAIQEEDL